MQLIVHARRFFGDAPTCPRRIFVEPFPRVLARHARQTERLRHVLLELAYASNAEMTARLTSWLSDEPRPAPSQPACGADHSPLASGLGGG